MGNYVDISDIESEFRSIDFGASGAAVSDAEVTEFIAQAEAYVDGKVSCKYAVPVTAAASTPILKTICVYLIKDRIDKIIKIKTNNKTDQEEGDNLRDVAEEMLKAIINSEVKLIGATLQESGNGVNSWTRANTSTFQRTFKRGVDQW